MKRGMKRYSAWRIESSSVEGVVVGKVLVDHGNQLSRTWQFIDKRTGHLGSCSGSRVARLCPTCVSDHNRASELNHDGACGPQAPVYSEAS